MVEGCIGAGKVVVDSARKTYNWQVIFFGQIGSTGDRAIASDDNKGINAVFLHILVCNLAAFGSLEVLRTSRLENRSTSCDNVTYALCLEFLDVVLDQALVASIDTIDFKAIENSSTCDGTNSCIHSWSIATTG